MNKSMIELQSDLLSTLTMDRQLNLPILVEKQCLPGTPMILLYTEHLILNLETLKCVYIISS